MDPRLLRYYNQELQHLREMGAEFAEQFPKIASRLRMDGLEVADPYVERLLEGFAFLAGRVQLKIDAEFPRFTQRMLEIVYPNYLAPTPSMLVAQLQPLLGDAALATGPVIPQGTMLTGTAGKASTTPCRFRLGTDVRLWPLEITDVGYFTHASRLPISSVPEFRRYAGGLSLKLKTTAGLDFSQLPLDQLRLHCTGSDEVAYKLHELTCGHTLGGFVLPAGTARDARPVLLGPDAAQPVGHDPAEALLPAALPGLDGYRQLQEYFAFPHRFLFFDLIGIGEALRSIGGQEVEIVLLFGQGEARLQNLVDTSHLALHCAPAVNLFEQRCDRISITQQTADFHVVPDRTRPLDYEVHSVLDVSGYRVGDHQEQRFTPLYTSFRHTGDAHHAYFALQREPRLMSTTQRRDGPRSSYIGSEVFLSIVDSHEAPYPADLHQLGLRALCTNRDLPLLLSPNAPLTLEGTAPVQAVRIVKGPSRPISALKDGNTAWRLISQLSQNHLSLMDADDEQGAVALREMLRLYVQEADAAQLRQVEGLRSVRTEPIVRRLPRSASAHRRQRVEPIAFGRGVRIDLEVDELAFQGSSAFLLGSVLEHFFSRQVSMNGFTETHLHSPSRGHIMTGRPRCGSRPIL